MKKPTTPCNALKAVTKVIAGHLRGAVRDIKKGQPRAASTKLYRASTFIQKNAKGILTRKQSIDIASDAFYVSSKLLQTSTMNWPKWGDRAEAMLAKVERIINKACP